MSLEQAYNAFKQRLLPSVLAPSHKNGSILGEWVKSKGHNAADLANNDPNALAELMFKAASDDDVIARLEWQVKPAKLKKYDKAPRETQSETNFADKLKQDEAKKANQKAAEAAQKATNALIDAFVLTGPNGVLHGKTNIYQTKLRARASRLQKFGMAPADIEKDIRSKATELFDANEKSYEGVGMFRDLLPTIEV